MPPETTKLRNLFIILIVFVLAILSRTFLFNWAIYLESYRQLPKVMQWLEQPIRWFLFCWMGLFITHRSNFFQTIRELGLTAPLDRALLFTFIACSPMLIGPLLFGRFSSEISPLSLLFYAGIWPLAEEILYRGYAFKQFYQSSGVGFWAAAVLTGLVFGLVHLGQASVQKLPLSGEIGTVALISVGGIVYAWLFTKWEFNLWIPFGMHMFMNLWWNVFDLADSPLGGWGANLLRVLTIVLAIILTLNRERIPIFSIAFKKS